MATLNLDRVITFFSQTLDAKQGAKQEPPVRAAIIRMLSHIVSRPALEDRVQPVMDHLIAVVKLALGDADWRTRNAVAGVIIAMGTSGLPYLAQIGGNELLHFVIKHASISDAAVADFAANLKRGDAVGALTAASPEETRAACRNAITFFAAAKEDLDEVLWPQVMAHMSQYAAEPALLNSFPTICAGLIPLSERRGQTEEFYIDFRVNVNIPKPGALAAIFLVQLMQAPAAQLPNVMEAMMGIAPLLDEPFLFQHLDEIPTPVASLWLATIPELQEYLTNQQPSQAEWEDIVCKLVGKTVTSRKEADWAEQFAAGAIALSPAYAGRVEMYRANLVVACIALGKCPKRDFVLTSIENIIEDADHDVAPHRAGLAKGLGFVAANKEYVDVVLDKLASLAKGPEKKGFFSFGKKEQGAAKKPLTEKSRELAGVTLCHVLKKMPVSILSSRVDATIIPLLTTIIADSPDVEVRIAVLAVLPMLEPSLAKIGDTYNFKSRDAFITQLLATVTGAHTAAKADKKGGQLPYDVACLGVTAISAVINAVPEPPLATAAHDSLVTFIVSNYVTAPPQQDEAREAEGLATMCGLVAALLGNLPTVDIDRVLEPINQHLASKSATERSRAVALYAACVKAAVARVAAAVEQGEGTLPAITLCTGGVVARLVPRFMDALPEIRRAACETIASVFRVHSIASPELFDGDAAQADAVIKEIKSLRARAAAVDFGETNQHLLEKEIAAVTKLLCGNLVLMLPESKQFSPLLDVLLSSGLTDPQPEAANCSCVAMHGTVRGMGHLLTEEDAKKFLTGIVAAAAIVFDREQTLNGLLVSARNLAKHHPQLCFNALVKHPAPHPPHVVRTVQSIAHDVNLARQLVPYCLDTILNSQIVEDKVDGKGKKSRALNPVPLSAVCTLGWVSQVAKCSDLMTEMRCPVFSVALLYLFEAHDLGDADAVQLVASAMQLFFETVATDVSTDRMQRIGWVALASPAKYHLAVSEMIKYLCYEELLGEENTDADDHLLELSAETGLALAPTEPTQIIVDIAEFVLPYANKPVRSQRRAAIVVAGVLIRHSVGEAALLDSLVTALLGRTGPDEEPAMRLEALQAFGQLPLHAYTAIASYVSPVMSAMLSNFDDPLYELTLRAMDEMHALLTHLPDKQHVRPIVVNIMLRIKGKFNLVDDRMRASAIAILTSMVEMGHCGALDAVTIEQQAQLHVMTLLVHTEDKEDFAREAAKRALAITMQFIASRVGANADAAGQRVDEVFGKPHVAEGARANVDEFLDDWCSTWAAFLPGKINDATTAAMALLDDEVESVRFMAASFCGYMLKHVAPENLARTNAEQVVAALIALVKREKSVRVRKAAGKSLGMLPVV
jgi:hypothetical protein